MMKTTPFLVFLILLMTACAKAEPTPTPTQVAQVVTVTVTLTTTPTPSPTPTATTTSTPTVTSTPSATATPTITPTPLPTAISWVEGGTPVPGSGDKITVENAAQVTELAHWGRGTITDIDLSADGNWAAVASGVGVTIHDAHDLAAATRLIPTHGNVSAVSISPTGDKVALNIQDREIQVWQVEPLKQFFIIPGVAEQPQFSPDGTALAVSRKESIELWNVELWDILTGKMQVAYSIPYSPRVRFSASGSQVAVWSQYDDLVKIYDWRQDQLINELDVFIHPAKEGEYQAITGDLHFLTDEDIRILVLEGEAFIRLSGRIEVQRSIDGAVLFTAGRINSLSNATKYVCNEPIIFWDPPEPPTPFHMEVSSDGQIAAMRYEDVGYSGDYGEYSSMRFYEMTTGRELYSLEEGVVDFELSPDGQTWLAGFQDGRLQVRQLHDGTVLDSVDGYDSPILDLTISPDGQQVGVVYVDEVRVYRREDGAVLYRYPAVAVSFAPEEAWFALGYADGRIELRSMADGTLIRWVTAHQDRVTALTFLLTGELLSAGFDCNLRLWDVLALTQVGSLENYLVEGINTGEQVPYRVQTFLVMPNGMTVIGLLLGGDFIVWSATNGHLIRTPTWEYFTTVLAVDPQGDYLAVLQGHEPESWDSSIHFLSIQAQAGAVAPDSSLLGGGLGMSGAGVDEALDGAVQLWAIPSLSLLTTLTPHTDAVMAIAFTPDGQVVVSGALDGVIRLWGIP